MVPKNPSGLTEMPNFLSPSWNGRHPIRDQIYRNPTAKYVCSTTLPHTVRYFNFASPSNLAESLTAGVGENAAIKPDVDSAALRAQVGVHVRLGLHVDILGCRRIGAPPHGLTLVSYSGRMLQDVLGNRGMLLAREFLILRMLLQNRVSQQELTLAIEPDTSIVPTSYDDEGSDPQKSLENTDFPNTYHLTASDIFVLRKSSVLTRLPLYQPQ
jgi:hypothetical protein